MASSMGKCCCWRHMEKSCSNKNASVVRIFNLSYHKSIRRFKTIQRFKESSLRHKFSVLVKVDITAPINQVQVFKLQSAGITAQLLSVFCCIALAQGTPYFASAHRPDTICDLSCLKPEGPASPQFLVPQFNCTSFL